MRRPPTKSTLTYTRFPYTSPFRPLNHAGQNVQQCMSRISKAIESDGPQNDEDDLWEYGTVRRDVGSLHIDQLTCQASDLARRNLLAVHPVTGWWKSKKRIQGGLPTVRFALVVEIDEETINKIGRASRRERVCQYV